MTYPQDNLYADVEASARAERAHVAACEPAPCPVCAGSRNKLEALSVRRGDVCGECLRDLEGEKNG